MSPQDYSDRIEKIYASLEKSRPLRSSDMALPNLKRVFIAGSLLSFTSAIVAGFFSPNVVSNSVAAGSAVMAGVMSIMLADVSQAGKFLLPLSGKSTPIGLREAELLSIHTKNYPRLVEIVGKWMADNPDGKLNMNNFYRLEKAVKKIQKSEDKIYRLENPGKKFRN